MQLQNKLGSGSFGEIYKGKSLKHKIDITIKCEIIEKNRHQRLKYEASALKYLQGGINPNFLRNSTILRFYIFG